MKNKKTGGRTKGTPNRATSETTLTPKQARFVSEYLEDLNGAAAAVRTGYNQKSADRQAYALLRKPGISKVVAATQAQRPDACGPDAIGPPDTSAAASNPWHRREPADCF